MAVKAARRMSAEILLEKVSQMVGANAATSASTIGYLSALYELCQQQRLLIEQWEEICQMRCQGSREIGEMVLSIGVEEDKADE